MNKIVKILSVGAGVQDVFLTGKVLRPEKDEDGEWVEELPVGAKLDLDSIVFGTGGGATNAAVTFARQGLHSAFMGKIAHDPAGMAVLADLHNEGVDTHLVAYSSDYNTGYSAILLSPNGERTILTYRGASTHYHVNNFNLKEINADWIYISSLAGCMDVLEAIIETAKKKEIKIAINPGKSELKQKRKIKELLKEVNILSLNKEELQMLVDGENNEEIIRNAAEMIPVVVMTDGPRGLVATDRNTIIKAGMYEDVPVRDRTGAGDAFCSGFVSSFAKGLSLKEAVIFGSANSTSVVQYIGAKEGILNGDVHLHDMPIKEKPF
ncbi:carbohydrate kinase family protein [Candidatus Saccharibacteria bacterium CPR2]|nr:carbohydrate kinase family protein [Candidatus Saccharibacteria bacterium CPR2]